MLQLRRKGEPRSARGCSFEPRLIARGRSRRRPVWRQSRRNGDTSVGGQPTTGACSLRRTSVRLRSAPRRINRRLGALAPRPVTQWCKEKAMRPFWLAAPTAALMLALGPAQVSAQAPSASQVGTDDLRLLIGSEVVSHSVSDPCSTAAFAISGRRYGRSRVNSRCCSTASSRRRRSV